MSEAPIPVQIRGAIGLITEDDAAQTLLLTSTNTLATWRSQGTGPAYVKLGKRVFYTMNDLRAWIEHTAKDQALSRVAATRPAAA